MSGRPFGTQPAPAGYTDLRAVLPIKGEIWRHTKTGGTYRIVGTALNAITDALDVVYKPTFQTDFERFTRQLLGHEKAFLSTNEDGQPRFVRVEG